MRMKLDFVTNSSSTCWIILGEATFEYNGEEYKIEKYIDNCSTIDMIKMIEGDIQYKHDVKSNSLKIVFNQKVYDASGDGWDGGDYQFAGPGWRFFGRTDVLDDVMNKENVELEYQNGRIIFPEEWITEDDPDVIKEKYSGWNIVDIDDEY